MTDELAQWSAEEQAELKKVFFASAYEIVENLQDELLAYEADPTKDHLTLIKRYVHTLKGDSNSVGLTAVGDLCHRMEDVISSLLGVEDAQADHEAIDLLLAAGETIRGLLETGETGAPVAPAEGMLARINRYLAAGRTAAPVPTAAALTEYQELQIREAAAAGRRAYDVEAIYHPECAEKAVAARMAAERLSGLGQIIQTVPALDSAAIEHANRLTVVLVTARDREAIGRETVITGIIAQVIVREHQCPSCRLQEAAPAGGDAAGAAEAARQQPLATSAQVEFLRIEASRVDRIMNLMGELIIGRSMIDQIARDMQTPGNAADGAARLRAANAYLERTLSDLQKGVMRMRMVSVNQVFRKFPKMVRDLSAEKGKPVRLVLLGKETELDKGIVDRLGEPLAHIIRNMIDHGIEGTADRLAAGKPAEGVITLKAYHEASRIIIEASDDGRGIDTEKLKRRAVEKGFLRQEDAAALNDADAVNLIYLGGLSTADAVTETSGRGVGMDAVQAAVEAMRGTIETETMPGKGLLIRLRLPLTLAVIRALLFEAGAKLYALPVSVIAEVAKVMTNELVEVNGQRTLLLRDEPVSLISIQELFGAGDAGEGKKFVLVLGAGERQVGILVDRLLWQQELVIKAIDGLPVQSGLVAGASILGDGKVVMILDSVAVVKKAVEGERKRLTLA